MSRSDEIAAPSPLAMTPPPRPAPAPQGREDTNAGGREEQRISRRTLLKGSAAAAGLAVLAGCSSPRRWITLEPFVHPPEEQLAGQATYFASTCRQCPAGCGTLVRLMNGRALKVEGNPQHPLNQGRLCARGQTAVQLLYNPDRLSGPAHQSPRGSGKFKSLAWNEALNLLIGKMGEAGKGIAVWGSPTVSGHLYELFRRYTAAVGAAPPLVYDLFSAIQGLGPMTGASQKLLGAAGMPAYDLSNADVVISFGADMLGASTSQARYGIEYGQFRDRPLGKRGYWIQLEPRMSITGVKADRWLPVRPGSEALVAQALTRIIADQKLGSAGVAGRAAAFAGNVDIAAAAAASEITAEQLQQLARVFAESNRPLALAGSQLAGRPNAHDAVNAVQSLNVIAGGIGQPGGVALQAAIKNGLATPPWSSFADAQQLVDQMRQGTIKLLLVSGANPEYELPAKLGFAEALKQVPFVVSFAPIVDETAALADLVMPDRSALESWGYQLARPDFGAQVVSSQQPVVTPVFDSRSTADVMLTAGQRVGATRVLPYPDEVAFLKETVAALGPGDTGGTGPDVLWARFLQHGGWWSSKKPAAPAPAPASAPIAVSAPVYQGDEKEYPYLLHLYLSELLADGRDANLPWLQGSPDPMTTIAYQTWVEIHPDAAAKLKVKNGDEVTVTSPEGEVKALVYVYPAIRPDTVAIPFGQGHTNSGRYARGHGSNALQLVGANADAQSGALTWANLRVKVAPTGKHVDLATFEWTEGVRQGFLNAGLPGQ